MPIPKPNKDESQQDFVSRCIKFVIDEGTAENSEDGRKQAAAMCYNTWRDAKGKKSFTAEQLKQIGEPDPDESYSDFMNRCTGENLDSDICQEIWDRTNFPAGIGDEWGEWSDKKNGIVHKLHADDSTGMEFVLSDATPDRFGDVVEQGGWELTNFKKNPIALFNHNKDFIVGKWTHLGVKNDGLRGHLQLAPKGSSERIDEIRALVDAGILRATSVGFRPLESRPLDKSRSDSGMRYVKNELVETSLVAVPANPNALAVAKSLGVSDDTLKMIFAKHGKKKIVEVSRGITGKNAEKHTRNERRGNMEPLATRIKNAEQRIVKLKDQLSDLYAKMDDENPSDEDGVMSDELTAKIDQQEKLLGNLKKAEQHIMATVERQAQEEEGDDDNHPAPTPAPVRRNVTHFTGGGSSALETSGARPFAVPAKKIKPIDHLWRSLVVQVKHHASKGRKTMTDIMVEEYGEDGNTKAILDYVTRTATLPATTTGSGWVDALIQTMTGQLIEALTAVSIYPKLAALGSSYSFGRDAGKIVLPVRTAGNLGGGFVAEGNPVPVKAGAFTTVTLTPKKLGVITVMTRQAANYSSVALESVLRDAVLQDTAVALDTILMGNQAAGDAVTPQGLQNVGGSALSATTGGGIAALIGDLKSMVLDLVSTTSGNIRNPVWIIGPGEKLAMSLTQAAAGGDLPFRDELGRGTLLGFPVISSVTGTSDVIYLMDAADFMTATGAPQFDTSDQAVLHMESSPAALATGTGPTVATPIRSLYQTDSMAVRLLWDLDWAVRRQNVVSWITGVTWAP